MAWYNIFSYPELIRKATARRNVSLLHQPEDVEDIRVDKEHGAPGNIIYGDTQSVGPGDEYNSKFIAPELFDTVTKMRKGDSSITAVLAVMKLPLLRTEVKIISGRDDKSMETEDKRDKLIVETCQHLLLDPGAIHETWQKQLRHILLMLDFGFSVLEKVWTQDEDGFLRFAKIAPRLPQSITGFQINADGSIKNIIQQATKNGKFREMKIPAPLYGANFPWNKEGENHWGESVLRPIYKHWFYKEELYRIDAVRLDRWGTGIPRAKIKEGYTLKTNDRRDLQNMLMRMRGGEQAYIIHPEQVDVDILIPGVGGSVDLGLMNSVYHHDLMIYRSVLAHFIATANSEYGNYGSTRTYSEVFFFAEQALANVIEDLYGEYFIHPFCDANFNMEGRAYPRLQFADVQKFDMGLLSETLSRFGMAGLITPDDDMESFLRKTFGWPKLPQDFSRTATGIINPASGLPIGGEPPTDSGTGSRGGARPGAGAPKKPTAGAGAKVDQRPVLNRTFISRILALNERLMKFIEEEL